MSGAWLWILGDGSAVRSAVEEMKERLRTTDLRFLIQKYLPDGTEIIVGAKAEEGLGHLVMFGMGGIYVEVMKDVVFKLAPVTAVEAQEMISSLQGGPVVEGRERRKGVDEERIVEIIQRVSQLVTECPTIQELDLNPIVAYADQVTCCGCAIAYISSPGVPGVDGDGQLAESGPGPQSNAKKFANTVALKDKDWQLTYAETEQAGQQAGSQSPQSRFDQRRQGCGAAGKQH